MIFNFTESGIIRKKNVLIQYYKKAGLNENQLAIVLLVMELSKNKKLKTLTPTYISEYTTLDSNEIEKELAKLNDDKLIIIDTKNKKSKFLDLTPLFNKIFLLCENDMITQNKFDPIKFIEKYFSIEIDEIRLEELNKHINLLNNQSYIIEVIMKNNLKNIDDFIKIIKVNKENNVVQLTAYNWLNE